MNLFQLYNNGEQNSTLPPSIPKISTSLNSSNGKENALRDKIGF